MSKKRSSRRSRSTPNPLPLFVLLVGALIAGWFLFHPVHRARTHLARATHGTPVPVTSTATPGATTPNGANVETTPAAIATPLSPTATPASTSPSVSPTGPKLALIIDDCGQWIDTERGFVALPIALTMSVLPDVHYTTTIAQEAAAAGKGVMMHLPMETMSGMDPGPGKVTTEMDDDAITTQVEADLAQVPLARGVNNHEGSKASADQRVMGDVMRVLARHGVFFIDSRTSAASIGKAVAAEDNVPSANRDVFLDNQANVAYSEGQLRAAAEIAERTGSAIAIGHPRPTTLEAVRALLPEFHSRGITFVLAQSLTH